ncbi:MAG TPA: SDR family oxidoreductase [Gaiellaceae bacterium]|nr:SDR family oxidoreductase [Gaiellaceae bacterium]
MTSKVAIITGGGGVLGRASALGLAREGYAVAVAGRSASTLEATVSAVQRAGGRALAVIADVAEPDHVDRLFRESAEHLGPCSALLHCAATHGTPTRLATLSLSEWEAVMRVNLRSTFLCTQAALAQMLPARSGSIVLVSSAGALRGFPLAACYAATKSALFGFARTVAAEVGPDGVRVNVLVPGAMPESAIYQSAMPGIAKEFGYEPEQGVEILTGMSAMRRVCSPGEIAEAAVFLATDRSSAMTGQTMVVDGGLTV